MNNNNNNNINLDILPKDGNKIIDELKKGNMVIARSGNDFLYMLDKDSEFHLFTHSPGSQQGGKKQFPKDEKHTAIMRNFANLADTLYLVIFDKSFDIFGVMYSAEEGILNMFPGNDRDADEDIEFIIPDKESVNNNG
ncbi:MAG: hypothetical protein JW864_07075 [Spirochaetes bacterium]|nr:hypothetical protein [Spirochaetota bacterium]